MKDSLPMPEKKILIVDDDPRNIFAMRATLRSKSYECFTCEDAHTALEILKKESEIAVVLLDMMMPEMDGYEAIPKIRSLEKNAQVPVIAVTAQAMPGDREKCLRAGADDYISKPVDVDRLLQMLKKYSDA